jgi:hypothetical protein
MKFGRADSATTRCVLTLALFLCSRAAAQSVDNEPVAIAELGGATGSI